MQDAHPAGNARPTLDDVLHGAQNDLLQIRRRRFALQKVQRELDRVSRGKRFMALNDVVWWMLADHHHVLVTELASWAKSHCQRGGLFGQLGAHHVQAFPKARGWGRPNESGDLRSLMDRNHAAAYERLFPGSPDRVKPDHLVALGDRFHAEFRVLMEDRNERAHPYEDSKAVAARMLDGEEVGLRVEYAAKMLNDLTLVASGSTHHPSELNVVDTEENAVDITDQVLIGPRTRQRAVMHGLDREAYYAALHRLHDASAGGECFNDPRVAATFHDEYADAITAEVT